MTRLYLTEAGDTHSIRAKGHADTKEVCGAISTILFAVAGWVEKSPETAVELCRLDPGDAEIVWTGGRQVYELAAVAFAQAQQKDPVGVKLTV